MKVVICGSYGDMVNFRRVLDEARYVFGKNNVFPTDKHLELSKTCIQAHHKGGSETRETIYLRSKLMKAYFDAIDRSDLVVIVNEKNFKEYNGVGTMIELGYAFARGKEITFWRQSTNANIKSLQKLREDEKWK